MGTARLNQVTARLGDAVVDPAIWPEIMEQICAAVGATGAMLLQQTDKRTPDVPRTNSVADALNNYFKNNWQTRDLLARGYPLLLEGASVVVTQDIVTPEE